MISIRPARKLVAIAAVVTMLASCAQPEKVAAPAATSHVTGVGKVTLHAGQPCASQVMFDFRITGARAIVQLAAPMRETKVLTEAANRNRNVRIWGEWENGPEPGCKYVNVTKAEPLSIAVMF